MDVSLEIFREAKHRALIDEWLSKHFHPKAHELPRVGYMATIKEKPIAAAFLRHCEGDYAILDSFVTNPEASGQKRHLALDELFNQLIKDSRNLGFKQLIGMSLDENTIKRACKHGFQRLPHTVLALDLRTESLQ